MSLYLDTSALVQLYVTEPNSARVEAWIEGASRVLTSVITNAEAKAAFALAHRLGRLSSTGLRSIGRDLDETWTRLTIVGIDEALVRQAGRLAERHALRGYDAVQLASAIEVRPRDGRLVFGSFDDQLNRAAVREKLALPPEPDLVADRPRCVVARRRAG